MNSTRQPPQGRARISARIRIARALTESLITLQGCHGADLRRDWPGEVVDVEVEVGEVGELPGQAAAEPVVVEVEPRERGEARHGGRERAGEPLPLQASARRWPRRRGRRRPRTRTTRRGRRARGPRREQPARWVQRQKRASLAVVRRAGQEGGGR